MPHAHIQYSPHLQDNITFGLLLEPKRYAAVVAACALADDIESLPAGDATELGERGINLSGAQLRPSCCCHARLMSIAG